jgi:hypothetical protein
MLDLATQTDRWGWGWVISHVGLIKSNVWLGMTGRRWSPETAFQSLPRCSRVSNRKREPCRTRGCQRRHEMVVGEALATSFRGGALRSTSNLGLQGFSEEVLGSRGAETHPEAIEVLGNADCRWKRAQLSGFRWSSTERNGKILSAPTSS